MYDSKIGRFLSEDPIGFDGGDANLARYVANRPLDATDPTGLTIQISVPVLVADGSYAKHKKTIDAVLAYANTVLADLDIALTATVVQIPNTVHQDGKIYDVDHFTRGPRLPSDAAAATTFLFNQLKTDPAFLKAEFAASKVTKFDYLAIIYTQGNGNSFLTFDTTKVKGAQFNLKDVIDEKISVEEAGRQFAHEFVTHILLKYSHLNPSDHYEMGLTKIGDKPNVSDECVSKKVAADLKKLGATKINPVKVLPR